EHGSDEALPQRGLTGWDCVRGSAVGLSTRSGARAPGPARAGEPPRSDAAPAARGVLARAAPRGRDPAFHAGPAGTPVPRRGTAARTQVAHALRRDRARSAGLGASGARDPDRD